MTDPRTARKIRQLLAIDELLGVDQTPVHRVELAEASESATDHQVGYRQEDLPARPPGSSEDALWDAGERQASGLNSDEKGRLLAEFDESQVQGCVKCGLCEGRTHIVFGVGNPDADLMFVGEGPGADEDRQGEPFVGRAGQLLDKQIAAMGLTRGDVYIANIVKCRPPGNRAPTPDEAALCMPYLRRQIEIIEPRVIMTLGATAAKLLLDDPRLAITRVRGSWRKFQGIDVMPTFHPAYLLRSYTRENRSRVWSDLQKVMQRLGLEVPKSE